MPDDPTPTPAPAPVPAPAPPAKPADQPADDKGFPVDTPVAEMTPEERVAYERHKREENRQRRREWDEATGGRTPQQIAADLAELEGLRNEKLTPSERALAEAREAARAEARNEVAADTVKALLRMGLRARGISDDDKLDDIVGRINLSAHTDDKGLVNDEKVLSTIEHFAGTARSTSGPDTGQGNRGRGESRPSSVAQVMAARAAARAGKQ